MEKTQDEIVKSVDCEDMLKLMEEARIIREFAGKSDLDFVESTALQSLEIAYLMGQKSALETGIKAIENIQKAVI